MCHALGGIFCTARAEAFWLGSSACRLCCACLDRVQGLRRTGLVDQPSAHGIVLRRAAFGLRRLSVSDRERKECGVNPEPFLQLDRVIHEKGRLAIMSMLAASPELSFTELRDALEMTDGNLTTHIRTLQEAGYVSVAKSYQNNRPLTTCTLTPTGKKAFASYVNLLEQIVQQNKPR
ncbi:MAG: ArsR family transcriptional regulator [Verrucomicrobia bacterium]|nr:ArsR family transcriptional regulator [Verrucomicrobiota bacterium]